MMPAIFASEVHLYEMRPLEIVDVLQPITEVLSPASDIRFARNRSALILGIDDTAQLSPSHRSWRIHAVDLPLLIFNYFEIWVPTTDSHETWTLRELFFSAYELLQPYEEEKEYIAFHCHVDDSSDGAEDRTIYRLGPHVHISAARSPLSEAHLPLVGSNYQEVWKSVTTLNSALKWSMRMLANEVLKPYVAN